MCDNSNIIIRSTILKLSWRIFLFSLGCLIKRFITLDFTLVLIVEKNHVNLKKIQSRF
jgi:hypothetical protein